MSTVSKMIVENYHDIIKAYDPEKNTTRNILTKYEKVKIIGLRMEQLQRGAQPCVEYDPNNFAPHTIATQELMERKIPFMVCRTLPNGRKEYWRLDDMFVT
jgi:DNA-directed RNA polymerase subunit K/omega